jgi:hypothetical protein
MSALFTSREEGVDMSINLTTFCHLVPRLKNVWRFTYMPTYIGDNSTLTEAMQLGSRNRLQPVASLLSQAVSERALLNIFQIVRNLLSIYRANKAKTN